MVSRRQVSHAVVPRLLPDGGTVLVLGSGPSLTQADVEFARGHVDATIAVNDSYAYASDCTVLYAADKKWWGWHKGCVEPHKVGDRKYPAFTGQLKYALVETPWYPAVQILRRGPQSGLTFDPTQVALGYNGVYQSINVAVHLGATRILLLGVDMKGAHFFGHHPDRSQAPFSLCLERFATLVDPLAKAGVELVNCTADTALKVFPRLSLREAFGLRDQVAV
jgi:hypothetical protein